MHGSSSSSSPSPAATCSAILKPWYARLTTVLVVATLFIPPVVLLVPLFLTVLDLPVRIARRFAAQQLLGHLAAGRRQRLQRAARQALLREPARGADRGGAGRRVRGRSGCCGRSCCRCPSRSSAWCRCSPCWPPGRTSSGRWWRSQNRPRQPLSVRLPTIRGTLPLDVFLAAVDDHHGAARHALPRLPALLPARRPGLGGAVKG